MEAFSEVSKEGSQFICVLLAVCFYMVAAPSTNLAAPVQCIIPKHTHEVGLSGGPATSLILRLRATTSKCQIA